MIRALRSHVLRYCLTLVPAVVLLAMPASGQNAPPAAAPGGAPMQRGPGGPRVPYKPKNLKVLPDNTDLRKVMREFAGSLGVKCEYCHIAPDPLTKRADRASDANPMKEQARVMIQMTDDLNQKYLPLLAKPTDGHQRAVIACGTCHRGEKHPPAFVLPPQPEGNRPPGAPAGPMAAPANPS